MKAPANIAVIQSPYFITDNVNDFNKDNIGNGPNPVESSSTPGNTGLTPGKIVGIVVAAVIAFTIIVALITIGIVYAKKPLHNPKFERDVTAVFSRNELSFKEQTIIYIDSGWIIRDRVTVNEHGTAFRVNSSLGEVYQLLFAKKLPKRTSIQRRCSRKFK